MASSHHFPPLTAPLFFIALSAIALGSAGCQQAQPTRTAHVLAAPRPVARPAVIPPPPPVAVTPPVAPVAPRPAPRPVPGIPREWAPLVAANNWKWIVIHHSATTAGGALRFDKEHREVRHFDELGYHFVVGNGTDTADGQVEVGPRWPKQKWGAHAQTPDEQFNKFGIGICLVGNFDKSLPSTAQMRATANLVAYLMRTYHIPPSHIIGHGDTKPTDCPGRNMHVAVLRRMSQQILADAGSAIPSETVRTAAAKGELLFTPVSAR